MNFWRLYTPDQVNQPIITGEHNLALCAAAIFLAILAAMVLLPASDRYSGIRDKTRLLWLMAGSVAMGTGIWAMFFTNILALKLPFIVQFDISLVAVSIIPAIIASASCIMLYATAGISTLRLHLASVLLAIGVGLMHYIGMEALIVPADVYYIPGLFFLSIASSYAFSMVGLNAKIILSGHPRLTRYQGTIIGSIILGTAVSSTHFVAMSATFYGLNKSAALLADQVPVFNLGLFSAISTITLLLFLMTMFGSKMDRRIRSMAQSLQISENRFQRLSETTQTAILTFSPEGLTYANPAVSEITGCSVEELENLTLEEIFSKEFADFGNSLLKPGAESARECEKQFEIMTPAGETRWLYSSFALLEENDLLPQCLVSACDITEQKILEQSLYQLAYQDHLTKLANRASFMDRLKNYLADPHHLDHISCIALLNLDNFSQINDTFGHHEGDKLLIKVAERLNTFTADIGFVARINGDEFAILFETLGDYENIENLAKPMVKALNAPFLVHGNEMEVHLSIGITSLTTFHHKTAYLVMHEADIALHRAKGHRGTRWVLYDEEIDSRVKRGRLLQNELKSAVHNSKLELFYQPIVDAMSHSIRGFEALARWKRANGEWVSPDEFIVLAEKSGLIVELELWALETACRQIDQWNCNFNQSEFYVSVNISADTVQDKRLHQHLSELIRKYRVNSSQLKLELTERLMMEDSEEIVANLEGLIRLGCELMIDDFGTGYSSLSYLHKLPVKTLKVDRSFVINVGQNNNSDKVVNSIISLARSLDLSIIAEGIETLEQAQSLRKLGSTLLQGYLFSRPVDAKAASELFERQLDTFANTHKASILDRIRVDANLLAKH